MQILKTLLYLLITHYIDVETLSYARGDKCGNWCGTTLNTDTSVSQSN